MVNPIYAARIAVADALSAKAGAEDAAAAADANALSAKAVVTKRKWDSVSSRNLARPEIDDLDEAWRPLSAFPHAATPFSES